MKNTVMHRLILFILLTFPLLITAQNWPDFTETDEIAKKAPYTTGQSIESLSAHLTKNLDSDILKVRAFYVWVTHNIRYDAKLYYKENISGIHL